METGERTEVLTVGGLAQMEAVESEIAMQSEIVLSRVFHVGFTVSWLGLVHSSVIIIRGCQPYD